MSAWKAYDDSPAFPPAPHHRERDPDFHVEELVRRMIRIKPAREPIDDEVADDALWSSLRELTR